MPRLLNSFPGPGHLRAVSMDPLSTAALRFMNYLSSRVGTRTVHTFELDVNWMVLCELDGIIIQREIWPNFKKDLPALLTIMDSESVFLIHFRQILPPSYSLKPSFVFSSDCLSYQMVQKGGNCRELCCCHIYFILWSHFQ